MVNGNGKNVKSKLFDSNWGRFQKWAWPRGVLEWGILRQVFKMSQIWNQPWLIETFIYAHIDDKQIVSNRKRCNEITSGIVSKSMNDN